MHTHKGKAKGEKSKGFPDRYYLGNEFEYLPLHEVLRSDSPKKRDGELVMIKTG